ncbi:RIP homotypic interaction motif-containing protein [Rhizohabitans arisaemae]|uniref:RIP homotypic interaction motif-containing protein n=1 Tax=Rhizohabitans arisaemae TaxID=2720610 RepID=UPI0024B116A2|nr:RIP homotypic interaction motif-containing protein [Rhizohabitans arisaemae]
MRWRVVTWAAGVVGLTAAIGLVLIVISEGPAKAAGPAGVIAALCEVLAVTLAVTGWAGLRRSAAEQASRTEAADRDASAAPTGGGAWPAASQGEAAKAGKYTVDVRHAEGVQIGEHNTQHIVPRRPPNDESSSGARRE